MVKTIACKPVSSYIVFFLNEMYGPVSSIDEIKYLPIMVQYQKEIWLKYKNWLYVITKLVCI